jgi:capsular polysaccharide transport system permease protein
MSRITAWPDDLVRHTNYIRALVIRDLIVRFGRRNLGFVWSIFEPMLLTGGVFVIWSFLRQPVIHGIPVLEFVLTVYMPLTLWRHMTTSMVRVVSNNVGLLYHARLTPIDIVFARLGLEFLSTTAALVAVYLILLATDLTEPVQNWSLVLGAWLLIAWYHGAVGLLIAAASERWPVVDKFIQPAQYLALPLSGVWFMVDWLPTPFQRLILWNPQAHGFEMFRAGYFGEAVVTHYDPVYAATWALILSVVGVAALLRVRDYVHG